MAYVDLDNDLPGILGPMNQYPDTAQPMLELAEELLRGDSTLSTAQRELIAAYTSHQNDCYFCRHSHGSTAEHLYGDRADLVDRVLEDPESTDLEPKMKALLRISEKVAESGGSVEKSDIEAARERGATDTEIHDTVLITAAFCMYNRYVDGLGTETPKDEELYEEHGRKLAEHGYAPVPGPAK